MFGKIFKNDPNCAFSNFLSGPLIECLRYGNGMKLKVLRGDFLDLKLRSENYIFWEERKKGGNFQCKNVWKTKKNSDKLDFIPINGRRACQCKNGWKFFYK